MSDKTSLQLFNEAREAGESIGHSIASMEHDRRQLDLLPPAPAPAFLVLSLDGHKLGVTRVIASGEYVACCSCKARWSYKASQSTREMEAIFTAHVSFCKRENLTTL